MRTSYPSIPLSKMCEALAVDGTAPTEPVVHTDTVSGDSPVNLYEISSEDWEYLKLIEKGEAVTDEVTTSWLKECGLVSSMGGSLNLTQLAKEWLSQPSTPEMPSEPDHK